MATAQFIQEGKSIDYTPSEAVSAGDIIVLSDSVGISKLDIAANTLGALAMTGVFDVPKTAGEGEAIAQWANVYWDADNGVVSVTSGTLPYMGKVIVAAGDDDTTVRILLDAGRELPTIDNIADVADITAVVADLTAADPDAMTYAAPDGGATQDAEARASLAQLAADATSIRTQAVAAIADLGTQKAELDKLITDVTADKTKINATLAALTSLGLMAAAE